VSPLLVSRAGHGVACCGMSAGRGGRVGMDVGVMRVSDGGGLIGGGNDGVSGGGNGVVSIGAATVEGRKMERSVVSGVVVVVEWFAGWLVGGVARLR